MHTLAKSVPMLPAQFSAMFPNVVSAAYVAPSDPSGHIRRYCHGNKGGGSSDGVRGVGVDGRASSAESRKHLPH